VLGRFLSIDPVLADPETGASFNRYWYANNNPYKFTDKDGRGPPEEEDVDDDDLFEQTYAPKLSGGSPADIAREDNELYGEPNLIDQMKNRTDSQIAGRTPWDGEEGCVYCVDGKNTSSGKDYIGRTENKEEREKYSADGRNRKDAPVVARYPKGDPKAGSEAEQREMNKRGGKANLDNKRDEIKQSKWKERGVAPPPAPPQPPDPTSVEQQSQCNGPCSTGTSLNLTN